MVKLFTSRRAIGTENFTGLAGRVLGLVVQKSTLAAARNEQAEEIGKMVSNQQLQEPLVEEEVLTDEEQYALLALRHLLEIPGSVTMMAAEMVGGDGAAFPTALVVCQEAIDEYNNNFPLNQRPTLDAVLQSLCYLFLFVEVFEDEGEAEGGPTKEMLDRWRDLHRKRTAAKIEAAVGLKPPE